MPEITPMAKAETITITPQTTPPSQMPIAPTTDQSPALIAETQPKLEEKKENPPQDEKLLALARKEQALLRQRRELAQREKMQAEKYGKYAEIESLARTNQLEALKKLGMSVEQINEIYLNNGQVTSEMKAAQIVDEKLQTFTQQQAEAQKQATQQQYQSALKQINAEAQRVVESSEEFPIVKAEKAYDTVTSLIEIVFNQTGRVMPIDEALKEVEEYYEEKALQLAKLPKLSSKLGLFKPEEPQQAAPAPQVSHGQQAKTLTHKTTVSPSQTGPLTPQQRMERAKKIFYGETV